MWPGGMRTVERVLAMDPDRLAIYNYAHLPHAFMPQRRINEAQLPSAKVKLDILQAVVGRLTDAGYVFIGMDHFAKPDDDLSVALKQGRLQRNFQGYSTHADHDLIAIGVSSIGKVGASYHQNEKDIERYYAALDAGHLPVMPAINMPSSRSSVSAVRRSPMMRPSNMTITRSDSDRISSSSTETSSTALPASRSSTMRL